MNDLLDSPIEFLKGVGPVRGDLLKKELQIFSQGDLLFQFPFRYVDRTKFHQISALNEQSGYVQLKGVLRSLDTFGEGRKKRLMGRFRDETGVVELVWFTGINYLLQHLQPGQHYVLYGRVNNFREQINIPHPELELLQPDTGKPSTSFDPVYASTEKLNNKGLDVKVRRRLVKTLLEKIAAPDIPENLPQKLIASFRFPSRFEAIQQIHFPQDQRSLDEARNRLKFEELFFLQLRLLQAKNKRHQAIRGFVFEHVGDSFHTFYNKFLPFELTNAQKRVIKEIRHDLGAGKHMNRLLQGDVGSGKTMVALLCMLMAIDNGYQTCMMAPTEILAQQHFSAIAGYLKDMDISIELLTGSVKGKKRASILENLRNGSLKMLVGTHALLEDPVVFQRLGLAITDEQHRFGVVQRARLWAKSAPCPPHVLVMTATPIPRTLAMTLYGDLDVSVIDELPPGRKPIQTLHRTEAHRLRVFGFMKEEIALGRQVYVVYPLIEESETLDLQNLDEGYEALSREFPPPQYQISVVHGRMKAAEKEFEMKRFLKRETQIMVATTVIEVGVNVPNASIMVIENTERFGLSQLHQLRGRVGRGAEQSYCILMSSYKLSQEARERIQTMVRTNDGFEIAEADLKLRGPGDIEGTRQSGILNLRIADLAKDGRILQTAREVATQFLEHDPELKHPDYAPLRQQMEIEKRSTKAWSKIS
jgi:ATP-dependent DNA helicase RecG